MWLNLNGTSSWSSCEHDSRRSQRRHPKAAERQSPALMAVCRGRDAGCQSLSAQREIHTRRMMPAWAKLESHSLSRRNPAPNGFEAVAQLRRWHRREELCLDCSFRCGFMFPPAYFGSLYCSASNPSMLSEARQQSTQYRDNISATPTNL